MPEFYSNTDVLIAPSIWPESFGMMSREAKLAGVWVVASNAGGLAEDVEGGINGNVFEAGNVAGLTRILQRFDKTPENFPQKAFDSRKYTVRTVVNQVEELNSIYRKIVQNCSR